MRRKQEGEPERGTEGPYPLARVLARHDIKLICEFGPCRYIAPPALSLRNRTNGHQLNIRCTGDMYRRQESEVMSGSNGVEACYEQDFHISRGTSARFL